jgi:hypothetical protein
MAITLTCTCGQTQNVSNATAGQTVRCVGCAKELTIPPMGVLPTSKTKPVAEPTLQSSKREIGLVLLAAGILLLLATGVAWTIVLTAPEKPSEAMLIAQAKVLEPNERRIVEPLPVERKPPELTKKELPAVIEPVKPKELPPAVIEPVAQLGELPNPFLLPILPEPPPKIVEKKLNLLEPLKLVWKLQEGDVFYQELVVTQKPTFRVQGIPIASLLQYRIVSRFTVKKRNDDGSLIVEQKIESAKLLLADELTKSAVAGAVAQLPGATFTLQLSPKMDVTKFAGGVGGPKVGALQLGGGMGMQMTSLLDRDGWKELAQATFFQMDQPLAANARWLKPMTHNWGSLGYWSGQIHYHYKGKQENLHRVAYGLQLAYKAPGPGAVGMMKVNGANFQIQQAEGMLLFDSARGKVVAAEERFRVRGFINANLLGQNTQVEIEEDQHFAIRIHDKLVP